MDIIKTDHAFRGYVMHHKVELIERKDPINQLEASKSSIKDFFIYLLNETRRYQITLKVALKKIQTRWRN